MDQKDQKNQDKNLSELMEFDFDDILTDDLPAEKRETGKKASMGQGAIKKTTAPKAAPSPKQVVKAKRKRGLKITFDIATWVKDLALAAVILWALITFVASSMEMPDHSMEPTLASEEHFLISKLVYRFKEPDRGDVVAFEYENASGRQEKTISRVIGVPGDTVVIDEQGQITINGKALKESYSDGKTTFVPNQVSYPYVVPEDYYFVLSDNPAGTTDSRFASVGAVSKSDMIGRVFFCYWPKDSWRPIG